MTDTINQVREALELARDTFSRYEDLHREKGTEEGNRKANANAALMLRMEEALAALSHPAPDVPSADEVEAIRARADTWAVFRLGERPGTLTPLGEASEDRATLLRLLDAARAELADVRAKASALEAFEELASKPENSDEAVVYVMAIELAKLRAELAEIKSAADADSTLR